MASEADSIEQNSSTHKGERDEAQKYSFMRLYFWTKLQFFHAACGTISVITHY